MHWRPKAFENALKLRNKTRFTEEKIPLSGWNQGNFTYGGKPAPSHEQLVALRL
tara:strand:- start:28 stop:189 length:162 start_codon:yes stop_codon:yes gene_type:complete